MPKNRQPDSDKQNPNKNPNNAQSKPLKPNKNNGKSKPRQKTPPPDKLADFMEHFLNFWKDQFPNDKFWNDLLNFMMPHKGLDNSQLRTVVGDFSSAISCQINGCKFHPFGSTVTGLAFRGEFYVF